MMKRTHMAVGLAATLPIIINNPISIIGLLGSIAPDWDFYLGMEHRGFSHSFLCMVFTTLIISLFGEEIWITWLIGYFSHIMLDSLTIMGVPFLHPWIKVRCYLAKFRTGSGEDYFIQLIAISFICFRYIA